MKEKKKLGEMLIEKDIIDMEQLETAIGRQKQWGGRLGFNLVKLNYISEIVLMKFLCSQLKVPGADLARTKFKKEVLSLITADVAKKHNVIPLDIREVNGKTLLFVAMTDPYNLPAMDELRFLTGITTIKPVIVTETQISRAIAKYYEDKNSVTIEPLSTKVEEVSAGEIIHEVPLIEQNAIKHKHTKNDISGSPEVIALVNLLIKKGVFEWDEYMRALFKEKSQR